MTVTALVVGILLASGFLLLTRAQPDGGRRFYAIGLAVTALIYVVFALIGRGGSRSLGLELVGVLLYGAAAWVGYRSSVAILALGWALHVVWDVTLHLQGAGAGYTPDWYPWGCVSFDLMVAGAALTLGAGAERRSSRTKNRSAASTMVEESPRAKRRGQAYGHAPIASRRVSPCPKNSMPG
jgi:hypothetical protein